MWGRLPARSCCHVTSHRRLVNPRAHCFDRTWNQREPSGNTSKPMKKITKHTPEFKRRGCDGVPPRFKLPHHSWHTDTYFPNCSAGMKVEMLLEFAGFFCSFNLINWAIAWMQKHTNYVARCDCFILDLLPCSQSSPSCSPSPLMALLPLGKEGERELGLHSLSHDFP